MLANFHLLRPWWLLIFIPILFLFFFLYHKNSQTSWEKICDKNLLPFLLDSPMARFHYTSLCCLFLASFFMIIALTGPTWSRLPVPLFKKTMPKVILLDLSKAMLNHDLLPDRLSRAKFILHDLLNRNDLGQIGLITYSGEPFVASPLTEDGKIIDALLPMLTPSIMPVEGQNLALALQEGQNLLKQAGFHQGQFLVFTGSPPEEASIALAKKLGREGVQLSIMPLISHSTYLPLFEAFAKASKGLNLSIADPLQSLSQWLSAGSPLSYTLSEDKNIPLWKDEGIWFIYPALFFLLPVFRRHWLQRIAV